MVTGLGSILGYFLLKSGQFLSKSSGHTASHCQAHKDEITSSCKNSPRRPDNQIDPPFFAMLDQLRDHLHRHRRQRDPVPLDDLINQQLFRLDTEANSYKNKVLALQRQVGRKS